MSDSRSVSKYNNQEYQTYLTNQQIIYPFRPSWSTIFVYRHNGRSVEMRSGEKKKNKTLPWSTECESNTESQRANRGIPAVTRINNDWTACTGNIMHFGSVDGGRRNCNVYFLLFLVRSVRVPIANRNWVLCTMTVGGGLMCPRVQDSRQRYTKRVCGRLNQA